jgi:hypothetical protein
MQPGQQSWQIWQTHSGVTLEQEPVLANAPSLTVRLLTQGLRVFLRTSLLGLFVAWAKSGRGDGLTHALRAPLRRSRRLVRPDARARGYMGAARCLGPGQLRRDLRAQSRRHLTTRHHAQHEPVLEHGRGALRTTHPVTEIMLPTSIDARCLRHRRDDERSRRNA